MTAKYYME